jgi:hypothetical protein
MMQIKYKILYHVMSYGSGSSYVVVTLLQYQAPYYEIAFHSNVLGLEVAMIYYC